MKAAVENAGNEYLKRRNAYYQACRQVADAESKRKQAETEMNAAGAAIREAVAESMGKQSKTLWLPFGAVIIEVRSGYTSGSGIYTHVLEQ